MPIDPHGSVTQLIADLRQGDEDAAQRELWERYFRRLLALARAKLGNAPRGVADEEDVVLSAFESLFRGVGQERFPDLNDRNNLWSLLAKITARKAINQRKWKLARKRGGDLGPGAALPLAGGAEDESRAAIELIDQEIGPDFLVALEEECRRLMDLLPDDRLRQIAQKKLEGYTNAEIAQELGVVERTIERKMGVIRAAWTPEA
ncbi:MAG: ECF-type sigma factor [Planctomycetota bacterium]